MDVLSKAPAMERMATRIALSLTLLIATVSITPCFETFINFADRVADFGKQTVTCPSFITLSRLPRTTAVVLGAIA